MCTASMKKLCFECGRQTAKFQQWKYPPQCRKLQPWKFQSLCIRQKEFRLWKFSSLCTKLEKLSWHRKFQALARCVGVVTSRRNHLFSIISCRRWTRPRAICSTALASCRSAISVAKNRQHVASTILKTHS